MEFRKLEKEELYKYKELLNDKSYKKFYEKRFGQLSRKEIEIFIIEDNGHIVGDITVNYISRNLRSETIPHVRVSLEAFRVRREYQNKGYGQKFLKYVISTLEKEGFSEITIAVNDDNEVARHIYFKLGFQKEIDRGVVDGHNYGLYLRKSNSINYDVVFSSSNINFVKLNYGLVHDYLNMIGDPYVSRFIFHNSISITEEDEINYVTNKLEGNDFIFSMIDKKTNQFIGNIELSNIDNVSGELGICITSFMQDKHYGSEGIKRFLEYSFEKFKLERIYLKVFPDNLRAIHVYEKLGFKRYDRRDNDIYMEIKKI